ncbi:hypothetical protein CEXT_274801, partial [Caerostris extrusa]
FVSVFAGRYVNADCEEEFNTMKKDINSMIDDGTAPQCVFDLDLAQFKCTGGEDPEEDEKKKTACKKWQKLPSKIQEPQKSA